MSQQCGSCKLLDKKEIHEHGFFFIKNIESSICRDKTGKHDRSNSGKNCPVYDERKE
jgi:hypothetical protein